MVFHPFSLDTVAAHYNTSGGGAESSGADSSTTAGSVRLTEEAAKKLRPLKKKDRILCDGVSDRLGVNIKVDKPALLSRQDSNSKPPARLRFPVGGEYLLRSISSVPTEWPNKIFTCIFT